uniref:Uncharacterized protein n=1 Tax=Oryza nivara TaxID=4536 RepID=A0A0E0IAF1_ORYNI
MPALQLQDTTTEASRIMGVQRSAATYYDDLKTSESAFYRVVCLVHCLQNKSCSQTRAID